MDGERIQYTTHGALIVPDQPSIPSIEGAGVVIMFYTATATFSTYFWTKFSGRIGRDRMILLLVILGSLFQSLLSLTSGTTNFIVIRMIQTGLIAGTIPLVVSIFAEEQKGNVIGFLNSARFAGNALGPIMATSVLAVSNLTSLYLPYCCIKIRLN